MIRTMDIRYDTFFQLYQVMNYRRTAELLNLTQPAVTKQIQSLEKELGRKLFVYDHHRLSKTPYADILADYVTSLRYNYSQMRNEMKQEQSGLLRLGATKTIGDFVILPALQSYLKKSGCNFALEVDNTEALLSRLEQGTLDFAIVEGIFDKGKYETRLLSKEKFIGICSERHPLANRIVALSDLFTETIIVREEGSGTRAIFEQELNRNGYSLRTFSRCLEIGSFYLINQLIADNAGISFVYEPVMLHEPGVASFQVRNFEITHEFNIVSLKHAMLPDNARKFLAEL